MDLPPTPAYTGPVYGLFILVQGFTSQSGRAHGAVRVYGLPEIHLTEIEGFLREGGYERQFSDVSPLPIYSVTRNGSDLCWLVRPDVTDDGQLTPERRIGVNRQVIARTVLYLEGHGYASMHHLRVVSTEEGLLPVFLTGATVGSRRRYSLRGIVLDPLDVPVIRGRLLVCDPRTDRAIQDVMVIEDDLGPRLVVHLFPEDTPGRRTVADWQPFEDELGRLLKQHGRSPEGLPLRVFMDPGGLSE